MFIPTLKQAEEIKTAYQTPVWVTDASVLRQNVQSMREAFSESEVGIFYAIKANYNPAIVAVLKDSGVSGIDAVSPNEVKLALSLGFLPKQITYTPSNPSTDELREVGEVGVLQNLGSYSELERYGQLFPDTEISLRISPDVSAGENEKVKTGGDDSKFGVAICDIPGAKLICDKYHLTIRGLHMHIGSGFYQVAEFEQAITVLLGVASQFQSVEIVDLGGGFGVQYRPDTPGINLSSFGEVVHRHKSAFQEKNGRNIAVRIEPGKYLVSSSTVLLATITTVKKKGETTFVGLDTGFNHLIRPVLYDAYHHVINVSRETGEKKHVRVVGNVCESGDIFNNDIELTDPQEGDAVAILVAGGYGSSMSSNYNMRGFAPEVMIDGDTMRLTRRKQTFDDITSLFQTSGE